MTERLLSIRHLGVHGCRSFEDEEKGFEKESRYEEAKPLSSYVKQRDKSRYAATLGRGLTMLHNPKRVAVMESRCAKIAR